jgi:hypothetical protein
MPFAHKPELLRLWVEHVTGEAVVEMLSLETRAGKPWFVAFEWIGDTDYLNECREGGTRARGANATAADAAVMYRDTAGKTHLMLIEWKYTESYSQPLNPGTNGSANETRRSRYRDIFLAPAGPISAGAGVTLDDFFYEPFYQMLRQQMLAFQVQKHDAGIDRAHVLHLSPSGNRPLHKVTSPRLRCRGDDAFEVYRALLTNPDDFNFMSIESAFAPLAGWPEAEWYGWLRGRYASLCAQDAV